MREEGRLEEKGPGGGHPTLESERGALCDYGGRMAKENQLGTKAGSRPPRSLDGQLWDLPVLPSLTLHLMTATSFGGPPPPPLLSTGLEWN